MKLRDWFTSATANPDLVGIVKVTSEEIDPEARKRHDKKLHRARAYLRLKKLTVKPLYEYQTTKE